MKEFNCRGCYENFGVDKIRWNERSLFCQVSSYNQSVSPVVNINVIDVGDGPFEGEGLCLFCYCELLMIIVKHLAQKIYDEHFFELEAHQKDVLAKLESWKYYDHSVNCDFINIFCNSAIKQYLKDLSDCIPNDDGENEQ